MLDAIGLCLMLSHESDSSDLRRRVLLQAMPISYNGLVIENTPRCVASCDICYQGAGPDGSDYLGDSELPQDVAERIIVEALQIATLFPRFHLSGGESFIEPDQCLALVRTARNAGYYFVSATTNAYWASTRANAETMCKRLRMEGLTSLEISCDYWHQQWIRPDYVSNCLDACHGQGIETTLRVLTTRTHPASEALSLLRPASIALAEQITIGPVFPIGRAAVKLKPGEFLTSPTGLGNACHGLLNLTVNTLGNVAPCCAGLDQIPGFGFGNVHDSPIAEIATAMNESPLLRTIVFSGIQTVLPVAREVGFAVKESYANMCAMCTSLLSTLERRTALMAYVSQTPEQSIEYALAYLEGRTADALTSQSQEESVRDQNHADE